MLTKNTFSAYSILIIKRTLRSRSVQTLSLALFLPIFYVGLKDSLTAAVKFFLFLHPYLFLFVSGDMMRDDIESGVLENILFLNGQFRSFLFMKNRLLLLLAFFWSSIFFAILLILNVLKGTADWFWPVQFLAGVVVGCYYLFLSTHLSFYFKGGSNVMVVIFAQLVLFLSLLFSFSERDSFLAALEQGRLPDLAAALKFSLLSLGFPNILITRPFLKYIFISVLATGLMFVWQWLKIKKLELKKT